MDAKRLKSKKELQKADVRMRLEQQKREEEWVRRVEEEKRRDEEWKKGLEEGRQADAPAIKKWFEDSAILNSEV